MSLYQKYRPGTFDSLCGQQHIKTILQNALKKNLVSHAYLFCGSRGTGKTSSARLIAKALNCLDFDNDTMNPCNKCANCESINKSELVDVIEIDAASNRGIDEMRQLKSSIQFSPTIGKNIIYIIDEVHMLTNEAFNALLKTLEEPPDKVYFILATTEVHKVPETIISRCQRFDFRRISFDDLVSRLIFICKSEKLEFEQEAIELIANYSNGGLRDAISILDQVSTNGSVLLQDTYLILGATGLQTINEFLDCLIEKNDKKAFEIVSQLSAQGLSITQFETDLMKIARNRLHLAVTENNIEIKTSLLSIIELWQDTHANFHGNPIAELGLEILTVKICNPISVAEKPTVVVAEPVKVQKPVTVKKPTVVVAEPMKVEKAVTVKKPTVVVAEPMKVEKAEEISEKDETDKLADLEKYWKVLINKINIPQVKITLKNSQIKLLDKESCELTVNSDFALERLKPAEHIMEIERIIEEYTKTRISVNLKKDKLSSTTVKTPEFQDVIDVFEELS